jgi:hypothetical protein
VKMLKGPFYLATCMQGRNLIVGFSISVIDDVSLC